MLIPSLCLWLQLKKNIPKSLSVNTYSPTVSLPIQKCWHVTEVEKKKPQLFMEGRCLKKHSAANERGDGIRI